MWYQPRHIALAAGSGRNDFPGLIRRMPGRNRTAETVSGRKRKNALKTRPGPVRNDFPACRLFQMMDGRWPVLRNLGRKRAGKTEFLSLIRYVMINKKTCHAEMAFPFQLSPSRPGLIWSWPERYSAAVLRTSGRFGSGGNNLMLCWSRILDIVRENGIIDA